MEGWMRRWRRDGGVFMRRQSERDDEHLHKLEGETELWMRIRMKREKKEF